MMSHPGSLRMTQLLKWDQIRQKTAPQEETFVFRKGNSTGPPQTILKTISIVNSDKG